MSAASICSSCLNEFGGIRDEWVDGLKCELCQTPVHETCVALVHPTCAGVRCNEADWQVYLRKKRAGLRMTASDYTGDTDMTPLRDYPTPNDFSQSAPRRYDRSSFRRGRSQTLPLLLHTPTRNGEDEEGEEADEEPRRKDEADGGKDDRDIGDEGKPEDGSGSEDGAAAREGRSHDEGDRGVEAEVGDEGDVGANSERERDDRGKPFSKGARKGSSSGSRTKFSSRLFHAMRRISNRDLGNEERRESPGRRQLTPHQLAEEGSWIRCFHALDDPSMVDPSTQQTILHVAASKGVPEAITVLLEQGANPNLRDKWGWTALHCASNGRYIENRDVADRHVEVCMVLLRHGADPTATRGNAMTALHQLASWSREKSSRNLYRLLRYLLGHVPSNARTDSGETPLHRAAFCGNTRTVNTLLKWNAHPNIQDWKESTPLHCAAAKGFINIVTLLLDAGANANAKDRDGRTPRDLAFRTNQLEVARLLDEIMGSAETALRGSTVSMLGGMRSALNYSTNDHIGTFISMLGSTGMNYTSGSSILHSVNRSMVRSGTQARRPVPRTPLEDSDPVTAGAGQTPVVSFGGSIPDSPIYVKESPSRKSVSPISPDRTSPGKAGSRIRASVSAVELSTILAGGGSEEESGSTLSQSRGEQQGSNVRRSHSQLPAPLRASAEQVLRNPRSVQSNTGMAAKPAEGRRVGSPLSPSAQLEGGRNGRKSPFAQSPRPTPSPRAGAGRIVALQEEAGVMTAVTESEIYDEEYDDDLLLLEERNAESIDRENQAHDYPVGLPPRRRGRCATMSGAYNTARPVDTASTQTIHLAEEGSQLRESLQSLGAMSVAEDISEAERPDDMEENNAIVRLRGNNQGKEWIKELGEPLYALARHENESPLEHTELDDFYYTRHFLLPHVRKQDTQKEDRWKKLEKSDFYRHYVFRGSLKGRPVLIAIKAIPERESQSQAGNNFRGYLRTYKHDVPFWVTVPEKRFRDKAKAVDLRNEFQGKFPNVKNIEKLDRRTIYRDMVGLDCSLTLQAHRFPVVVVKEDEDGISRIVSDLEQLGKEDQEMLWKFLHCLGYKIDLYGWHGYSGNLDTGTTLEHGDYAIFTTFYRRPILFPLVPLFQTSIGRLDVLHQSPTVIVYQVNGKCELPLKVTGERQSMTHSYIVVQPDRAAGRVHVLGAFKKTIGRFRPLVPRASFPLGLELASFLLHKLINSDRAAWFCREDECLNMIRKRSREIHLRTVIDDRFLVEGSSGGTGERRGSRSGSLVRIANLSPRGGSRTKALQSPRSPRSPVSLSPRATSARSPSFTTKTTKTTKVKFDETE